MAKAFKLGIFGGVFTPSVLTILGVIMYMRLPRLVGDGGLWLVLGVMLAAHVISVTTGLSVSSIATDKKVAAGGPYYIVSRSLGLPIGGTLGLALFIGLSFSVSLYLIGFAESIVPLLGYAPDDKDALRLVGSISLLVVTAVTLISTTLAIRVQYVIMAAIVLSLIGIFFGPAPYSTGELVAAPAPDGGQGIAFLFAIFFPAVTGFTAGVNMSGDLKDPKRAIPIGTMSAIAVGLVAYVGLAVFLASTVSRDQLLNNPNVLLDISIESWMVLAGIWGATLSSAIGSILGAPRILQAKSQDRLTPAIFAVGRGPSNEPRNALLLTFAIAEAGILIGELDVIASIISMFFIMMYGFLNLSCAFESMVSPDFRPAFRIPVAVSVIGAIACVVVMIQLNFLAMIAATLLFIGIFYTYSRRQLSLETGDTWGGVWTSLVRSGLNRLQKSETHHRNWRPNVVLFSERGTPSRAPLLEFTESLMSGRGIVTDVELMSPAEAVKAEQATPAGAAGAETNQNVFHRPTPTDDVYDTMGAVVRFYGFSGVEPNTVMIDWSQRRHGASGFLGFVDAVRERDLSLVVLAHDPRYQFGQRRRVDVWCGPNGENLALALALLRFVTTSSAWGSGELRFIASGSDAAGIERMKRTIQRVLDDNRIQATVVASSALHVSDPLEVRMSRISEDADLVIASLPEEITEAPETWVQRTDDLLMATRGSLMLIRSSHRFEESFRQDVGLGDTKNKTNAWTELEQERDRVTPLATSRVPVLAEETMRFSDQVEALVEKLHARHLVPLTAVHVDLVKSLGDLLVRQLSQLERKLAGAQPVRRRKVVVRAQSHIAFQTLKTFEALDLGELPQQRDLIADAIGTFRSTSDRIAARTPAFVSVLRPRQDFAPDDADPVHLRRLKWRRRARAWLTRRPPRYRVAPGRLVAHYVDYRLQETLFEALRGFATQGYQLLTELGRLALSTVDLLDELDRDRDSVEDPVAFVAEQRARINEALELHLDSVEAALADQLTRLTGRSQHIVQEFADDLDRLDLARLVRKQRKVPRAARETSSVLDEAADRWLRAQSLIVQSHAAQARLATYRRRLTTVVDRTRLQLASHVRSAVVEPCADLHRALVEFHDALEAGDETARLRLTDELMPRFAAEPMVEALVKDLQAATLELPDAVTIPTEAELTALQQQPFEPPGGVSLALRRAVGHLVEAQLVGDLQAPLALVPEAEQHALQVGRDVLRLLSFTADELESGEEGEPSEESVPTQLMHAAASGVTRLGAELKILEELAPRIEDLLTEGLARIRTETDLQWLVADPKRSRELVKTPSKGGPLRIVRTIGSAIASAVRRATVAIVYRRTQGALLKQRLRPAVRPVDALIGRSLAFVREVSPRPEILEELPFFYRQLFLGRSANDSTFWVGRERQLSLAAQAIANHRRGVAGALLAVGPPGSGKSAIMQRALRKHVDPELIYRIRARLGGSCDPEVFRAAAEEALQLHGSWPEIMRALPPDSAVVIDNLALWWERSEAGLAVVDVLLDLIDQYGDRCLFVVEVSTAAFRAINRFRRLSGRALAVIECDAVGSEFLRDVIEVRHRSAGLVYAVGGKEEDDLSDLRRARVFSGLFDASGGLLGPALQAWIATIKRVRSNVIELRPTGATPPSFLDDLPLEHLALIVQLALHRQLSIERFTRITGLPLTDVVQELAMLARMGLVIRIGEGVYTLDRFVRHHVIRHLEARELLP